MSKVNFLLVGILLIILFFSGCISKRGNFAFSGKDMDYDNSLVCQNDCEKKNYDDFKYYLIEERCFCLTKDSNNQITQSVMEW